MKYNIKSKVDGVNSTRMKMPDWVGRVQEALPASSGTWLDGAVELAPNTTRVRGVNVTSDSDEFNPSGLMGSGIYDEPLTLSDSKLKEWARRTTPVEDEDSVTDWMVPAKAYISNLKARSNEYKRAGSSLSVNAGDPFTPGVSNSQMAFKSDRGSRVNEIGNGTVIAGDREFDIPAEGGKEIITPNLLGWASATDIQEKQWIGSLMSFEELTDRPSQPIGFPNIGGNTGPMFLGHSQTRPAIFNRVNVGFQSSEAQTIDFKFRDNSDYTNVINSFSADIPKGQSTMSFNVLSLTLQPMVAQITPENNTQTVLTDYSIRP